MHKWGQNLVWKHNTMTNRFGFFIHSSYNPLRQRGEKLIVLFWPAMAINDVALRQPTTSGQSIYSYDLTFSDNPGRFFSSDQTMNEWQVCCLPWKTKPADDWITLMKLTIKPKLHTVFSHREVVTDRCYRTFYRVIQETGKIRVQFLSHNSIYLSLFF